jgi:hypothetical protein
VLAELDVPLRHELFRLRHRAVAALSLIGALQVSATEH